MAFGLVLGAGGQVGEAFHRGVVRAMHDLGFDARRAEVVVGTSAGSVMAASLRRHARSRQDAPQPVPPGARLRRGARRASALAAVRRPRQLLNALLLAPEFTMGRISAEFLRDGLADRYQTWPDADLYIVAVRRADGARVVFGRPGEPKPAVGAAVAASCAIPGYFSPIDIDGVEYVDGGLHSPTNADVLADRRLGLVIVSSPMSMQVAALGPRLDLPLRLVFHGYLREEVWVLRSRGTRVVTIEPDRPALRAMSLNMMDGRRIDEAEERAYELARQRLRDIPLSLAANG